MRKNFGVQTWLYPMPVLIIGTSLSRINDRKALQPRRLYGHRDKTIFAFHLKRSNFGHFTRLVPGHFTRLPTS